MNKKIYTLPDKLKEIASQSPDRVIMQMKKESAYVKYTYKKFYEASQSIAHFLLGMGIKKGDKIAIVLENRPEWGMIYFAILFAGGIAIPVDHQSSPEEVKFILSDSESKAAFTSLKHISLFEIVTSLRKIVVLEHKRDGDVQSFNSRTLKKCIDFSRVMSFAPDSARAKLLPGVSFLDIASILYTSGTTGRPKGVILTHKNFYSNFQSIDKLKLFSIKDNVLSILPLHHSFPFMATLITPLFSQGRITYISSLKSEELLRCMRETAVTVLVGVPQLFYMFYKNIFKGIKKIPFLVRMPFLGFMEVLWLTRKLTGINFAKLVLSRVHRAFGRNLRFFVCGGAELNEKVARFLAKIGFTILEGYGLTETSPVVTFNPLKKQKIGSVGKIIPGVKVRVDKPDEYGVGEVAIKGPNVMEGYYKQEEETKKVLKNDWFYSGDLGYLDKRGYLYLTGRKKEVIVLSSGKNISPQEVELYYAGSPFIKELCVLAVGKKAEEKLMAVIVPDMDYYRKLGEVNIYEIIKWELENLSKHYPSYKRIMGFVVANEDLPRTRLGKLKRFEVKNRYLDEFMGVNLKKTGREISLVNEDLKIFSSETGKKIIEILNKEANPKRQIRLNDHLEIDLGLDSLGRVELMVALERVLRIDMPDSLMAKIFTVRELILGIEKLILEKGLSGEEVLSTQIRTSLWNDILKANPSGDIIEKIDLFPGLISRVCTFLVCGVLYIIFKFIWRLKVSGVKNLPQKQVFILCSNHGSYLDAFLIAASVPWWLRKHLFFVGLRGYFEVPIIRSIVKLIRVIPIDPGAQLVDAMQACAYILRNNKTVCIFPEGVRSINGEIKEFKKGVGILAKELNVQLVPVYIKGSYESWPRTNRFPRFRSIKIVFGFPKTIGELKEKGTKLGAKDDYSAIALGIREEVVKLKPRREQGAS